MGAISAAAIKAGAVLSSLSPLTVGKRGHENENKILDRKGLDTALLLGRHSSGAKVGQLNLAKFFAYASGVGAIFVVLHFATRLHLKGDGAKIGVALGVGIATTATLFGVGKLSQLAGNKVASSQSHQGHGNNQVDSHNKKKRPLAGIITSTQQNSNMVNKNNKRGQESQEIQKKQQIVEEESPEPEFSEQEMVDANNVNTTTHNVKTTTDQQ